MKVTKSIAIAAIACGSSVHAASISNSGFETDTFGTSPGYISGASNGPITGWTASNTGRAGLNPAVTSPFANNGAIPEGSQVAFLQGDVGGTTTLTSSSGITGLTIGKTYNVTYRVNSRGANNADMGLVLGGSTVLRNVVSPVGAANPYKFVSQNFVATGSSMSLALNNSSAADQTLLIDAFTVTEVSPKITVAAWTGDATSGIDSTLTYTHAFNLGSAMNAVVNGETFTGISGGNPALAGSFSYNMGNAGADAVNNINAGGSATLSDNFVFNNANATLTLEGLMAGQAYRTSLFTVGFDGVGYGRASTILGPDGEMLTVDVNSFGNNNGARVDIEFIASGSSELIALNSLQSSSTFHTYAFSNAVIPEPSASALFVIGLGGLVLRRRRRV